MLYRNLPTVLKHCKNQYPGIEQALLEMNSPEQIELVERGGIDIGFIHANPVPETVTAQALIVEPLSICLPTSHCLADRSAINLIDLENDEFIFFSRAFSPVYYETLLAMCLHAGFLPNVRHEARHWLSVVSLVSKEMGVSIVPRCLSESKSQTQESIWAHIDNFACSYL